MAAVRQKIITEDLNKYFFLKYSFFSDKNILIFCGAFLDLVGWVCSVLCLFVDYRCFVLFHFALIFLNADFLDFASLHQELRNCNSNKQKAHCFHIPPLKEAK